MILTRISEHNKPNKFNEELEYSRDNDNNNQPILQTIIIPSDLNYIQPRATQYGTAIKLGLIPKECGTRSSVLTSYFKVKNVESANWRTSTIMVHVTCLYPS